MKYFIKNTGEELEFGDVLELDLTKDHKDGTVEHRHMECRFMPELVADLIDQDVIYTIKEDYTEILIEEIMQKLDTIEETLNALLSKTVAPQKKYVKKDTGK